MVERVSSIYWLLRLILAIKVVFEFPPREFFSRKVSFESQYQICLYLSGLESERPLITEPRTDRDLLMLQPSLNLSPEAPVCFCLSLPAKSIKLNLEKKKFFTSPWDQHCWSIIVKIEWDLDDWEFIWVSETLLLSWPLLRTASASPALATTSSIAPSIYTPYLRSSLRFKGTPSSARRSKIFSL